MISQFKSKGQSFDKIAYKFKKKLKAIKSNKLLKAVGEYMVDETNKRISTNSIKPATSSKTLSARRKRNRRPSKYPQGITLADTGTLLKSINYKRWRNGVSIGSNLVYARIHQLGGRTGRNRSTKIPKRPYLFFSFTNKYYIKKMISRAFRKGKI